MSRAERSSAESVVSKWVAPEVGGGSADHELLSEDSIARLRAVARQRGHAEGHAAGLKEGRADVQARLELLESMIAHLHSPLQQLEPDALEAMCALSVRVSQALIGRELSTDPALVLEAVRSALAAVSESESQLRIRVNPQDLDLLTTTYAEHDHRATISLSADAEITRGGAIVESGASLIDAQIESRLASILETLVNTRVADDS